MTAGFSPSAPDEAASLTPERARAFILSNTAVSRPPHVPEIRLHLADEAHELWHRTEEELQAIGLPPPFWAFAWAGGQALARYVLDHPETVRNRRVVDFAAGSGLVAIAAALAGASSSQGWDIDPFAAEATALNARLNGVSVETVVADRVGTAVDAQILLAGDVFFDREMARSIGPWFDALSAAGLPILVGDPGRAYLPRERLEALATYEVAVTRALEDAEIKRSTVWRWRTAAESTGPALRPR